MAKKVTFAFKHSFRLFGVSLALVLRPPATQRCEPGGLRLLKPILLVGPGA